MKKTLWKYIISSTCLFLIALCSAIPLYSQSITPLDSLKPDLDSLVLSGADLYVVSKDAIDEKVEYGARDSIRFDYLKRLIFLYGEAYIKYKTMQVHADFITIDMKSSVATAKPLLDSAGMKTGVPNFEDGDQKFDAQEIQYNFKTRKGIVTEVVSRQDDVYIHGEKTKFISKQSNDSGGDDVIYNQNAIFTTCDAPHPHFGIYSKRQKVIPNKLIVVGPSIVKIAEVPTPPLMLPFGFFPISPDRRSGILFPKDYEYSQTYGFGLRNFGYYIPVSQYLDLKLLGIVYFKGSWGINPSGNYSKRYKYDGSFNVDFQYLKAAFSDTIGYETRKPLSIHWVHRQAAGAHPYRNIGGSIDIETNGYTRATQRNASNYLNNTLRSNFNFTYQFPNSPFSLSAGMSHSQVTRTNDVQLTLPSVDFSMRQKAVFKRKSKKIASNEAWYEKILVNYSASARNQLQTKDSLLFRRQTLDTLQYGAFHRLSANASFNVLRYISITPSANYREEYFFKTQDKYLDTTTYYDSIQMKYIYGRVITDKQNNFVALRTMDFSLSASTKLYGMLKGTRSWFKGIRHEISPSVSMSFAPDYSSSFFNYYRYHSTDNRSEYDVVQKYFKFANSPFGTSGVGAENFQINMGVNNRVEMKYRRSKDSISHKLAILEGLSINSTYNVFADSFKLSPLFLSGNTRVLWGYVYLSLSSILDPYLRENINGVEYRRNQYRWSKQNHPFYFDRADLSISSQASIGQILDLLGRKKGKQSGTQAYDRIEDLFRNFSLSYNVQLAANRQSSGKDTAYISTHTFNVRGNLPLTPKWKITLGNIGYDIRLDKITFPQIGLERDLHCWVFNFNWTPALNSYTFFIGVKPGSLEFIRIPSNQYNTGNAGF
ncbi:MAG: LPS-assembly protein LptD [Saprospiraceae bacterium]|nr:LPS-assembly protein LptD [Saprospiraceae bacterium]